MIDAKLPISNSGITFDTVAEKFHYPDGSEERLEDYQIRRKKWVRLQTLQNALERLKILYQNSNCMNPDDYYRAQGHIEEEFGPETPKSIFQEYLDS
jgi:hypothetical protein